MGFQAVKNRIAWFGIAVSLASLLWLDPLFKPQPALALAAPARVGIGQQADPSASLSLPGLSANPYDTLTVDLAIDSPVASRTFQTGIRFDPSILRCDAIDIGPYYQDWANSHAASLIQVPTPACDNSQGVIPPFSLLMLGGQPGGPSGTGVVARVHFMVIGSGVSPLSFQDALMTDASQAGVNIPLSLNNGQVAVSANVTATITPSVIPVTRTVDPGLDCSRADVNQDGVVNSGDGGMLGFHWLETGPEGWIPEDVNHDGVVSLADIDIIGACWLVAPGSPTATPTLTPSVTATATLSATSTFTQTGTIQSTETLTSTATATATATPTPTSTPTLTPTPTVQSTQANTATSTATVTPTPTLSETPTEIPTRTATMTPVVSSYIRVSAPADPLAVGQGFDVNIMIDADQATRTGQAGLTFNLDSGNNPISVLRCDSVTEGSFYQDWAAEHNATTFPSGNPPLHCDNTNHKVSVTGISIMGGDEGGPSGTGTLLTIHFTALAEGTSVLTLDNAVLFNDLSRRIPIGTSSSQVTVSGGLATATGTPTNTLTAVPTSTYTRTPSLTNTQARTSTYTNTPTRTPTRTPTEDSFNFTPATQVSNPTPTKTPLIVDSNSRLGFNPGQVIAQNGEDFVLNLAAIIDKPVRSVQVSVAFNPNVMSCSSIEQGTFFDDFVNAHGASTVIIPQPVIHNNTGVIDTFGISLVGGDECTTCGDGHEGGATGNGTIFKLNCRGIGTGVSTLTIDKVRLTDDTYAGHAVHATWDQGEVFVGVTPTPTPLGGPTATPTVPLSGFDPSQTEADTTASPSPEGTPTLNQTLTRQATPTGMASTGLDDLAASPDPGAQVSGTFEPASLQTGGRSTYDLSGKLDANGILQEELSIQLPDLPLVIHLSPGTQALTADNYPLTEIAFNLLNTPPGGDPAQSLVGPVYDLGPSGAKFDPPATLVLTYSRDNIPQGYAENALVIATYDEQGQRWSGLPSLVDPQGQSVSAPVGHFSYYTILAQPAGLNWTLLSLGATGILLVAFAVLFYFRWWKPRKQKENGAFFALFQLFPSITTRIAPSAADPLIPLPSPEVEEEDPTVVDPVNVSPDQP